MPHEGIGCGLLVSLLLRYTDAHALRKRKQLAQHLALRFKQLVVRAHFAVHAKRYRHLRAEAKHLFQQTEYLPVRAIQPVDVDWQSRNERRGQQSRGFVCRIVEA
ncbi:hypothetical protein SDC9_182105 [bioreactor metagenome]|uniref:Uncharacterized protein n=1 Tax=bioreactor metagenome TaxID=1076179 RepID=A0A645H6G1_9ZZZZ